MSTTREYDKKVFFTAIALIILIAGTFSVIGLSPRPDAGGNTTTINSTTNITNNTTQQTTTSITSIGANLSKDFYQSGSGTSVSVTTSYAEILPQQTRTPMDMTKYTSFKMFTVVSFNAPTPSVTHTGTNAANPSNSISCSITVDNSGDAIIVGVSLFDTVNTRTITGISGTVGDSTYTSVESAVSPSMGGEFSYTFLFSSSSTSTGTDTITINISASVNVYAYCADAPGINPAPTSHTSATAAQSSGTPAIAGQSFTNNNVLFAATTAVFGCAGNTNPTISAGVGFTLLQHAPGTYAGGQYELTSGSGTSTMAFGTSCNTGYAISGAVFAPIVNTLSLKTQYSTDGGSSWNDVSATALAISSPTTDSYFQSSYLTIAVGAKGDYLFRVVVKDGTTTSFTLYKFGIEVVT